MLGGTDDLTEKENETCMPLSLMHMQVQIYIAVPMKMNIHR